MDEKLRLQYAISKQLPSIYGITSDYGEFELDEEMIKAVQTALTPILEKKIKELTVSNSD